jgi:hypothetical protein
MKRAAIGVRVHSGWGALVAVSNHTGALEVVERRRIDIAPAETPGAKQPYHFAQHLELPQAEKFLAERFASSKYMALAALQDVLLELRNHQYRVVASAVLEASGRPLPPLPKILGSHPLIHSAEGEFFRKVFSKACEALKISVVGLRERNLEECMKTVFGKKANRIQQEISNLGGSLGPPWTKDQKTAALAAIILLSRSQKVIPAE